MNPQQKWEDIRTDVRTLYAHHLGHAIDLLRQSCAAANEPPGSAASIQAQRHAISAVMHSVSSLEATLNYMAYRLFTLKDAPEYIPPERRGFFVQSMAKRWPDLKLIEKCNTILSVSDGSTLSNELQSRLSELNTYRNWIVHGKCYHSTLLVAPGSASNIEYLVVDEEPGESWKDWGDKFLHCHFNEPLALDHTDAQTALRIVVETLLLLSRKTGFCWFFQTCIPQYAACSLDGGLEANLGKILGMQ